jgi:hypothetical protein
MKFHLSLSMILEQIDSQSRTDSLLRGIDVNNPANLDAEGYPVGYGKKPSSSITSVFSCLLW